MHILKDGTANLHFISLSSKLSISLTQGFADAKSVIPAFSFLHLRFCLVYCSNSLLWGQWV